MIFDWDIEELTKRIGIKTCPECGGDLGSVSGDGWKRYNCPRCKKILIYDEREDVKK